MGGILIIMRASSQEAEARPRDAERALFRQDAKLFLHPIARFAAHSIRKIPPMEFQNLHHVVPTQIPVLISPTESWDLQSR